MYFAAPLRFGLLIGAFVAAGARTFAPRDHDDAPPLPVVGGSGNWTFRYRPDRLVLPAGACVSDSCNCHGLVVDSDDNIYLTYEPDRSSPDDVHCMVRFHPDGAGGVAYGSRELCAGTPHGLTLATETVDDDENDVGGEEQYLYHANNDQAVHKTTLDGSVVWSNLDRPPRYAANMTYKPTWAAAPVDSPHVYLVDGYGSQYVHVLNKTDGRFVEGGRMHGGPGTGPGKFSTCHGISVDARRRRRRSDGNGDDDDDGDGRLLIVSDRENHRHQYFRYDPSSPDAFDFLSEFANPELKRPCHFRPTPDGSGHAVIPSLDGTVGIVDATDEVVSTIDVAGLIGHLGHLHPHDAVVLPSSGDMVVATWSPGRVSYWERVRAPPRTDPPPPPTASVWR